MNVTPQTLDEITRRLVDSFHPEKVILFGSRAWGTPDHDSDIDVLVVVAESNQPPHRRASQAYRALQGLGVSIDVLVRTQEEIARELGLRASLLDKIVREGRVLHG